MPAKQYEVVRPFRTVDPRTGASTHYTVGDSFTEPVDTNPYLLSDEGPDGGGPLVADKQSLEKQRLDEKSAPDESATDKPPAKEK